MSQAPDSGTTNNGTWLAAIGVILVCGMGLIIGLPMLFPDSRKPADSVPQAEIGPGLKVPVDTGKDLFDAFEVSAPENVLIDPAMSDLGNGYALNAEPSGEVSILHNGKEVYSKLKENSGERISIVSPIVAGESEPVTGQLPLTRDITGDGVSELVLLDYTGGSHCCYHYSIFSLGPEFKQIGDIDAKDSSVLFKDLDGDGIFELGLKDSTFAYWNTQFSQAPLPGIVLRYKNGKYVLARDLMNTPPPQYAIVKARLKHVREEMKPSADDPSALTLSPALWGFMLDLIYTGNGELAWKVYDDAWPDGTKGWCLDSGEISKEEFLRNFRKQLAESPYWPDIKQLNHWS